jgi:hypothetical protein
MSIEATTAVNRLVPYFYPKSFFNMTELEIKKWAESVVAQLIRIITENAGYGEWTQQRQNSIQLQVKKYLGTQLLPTGEIPPYSVLGRLSQWVGPTLESAFAAGAGAAGDELYVAGITSFYKINVGQLDALVQDTFDSLAQSVQQAEMDLGKRLNQWKYAKMRSLAKERILSSAVKGKNFFTTGQELADDLRTNGIMGFVDKAGKKWTLETYTTMLVRTKLKETHSAGFIDQYNNIPRAVMPKLIQIGYTDYTTKHMKDDSCAPYQKQQYFALNSADAKEYKLPLLKHAPPFHPNCEHIIRSYIPRSAVDYEEHQKRLKNVQERHANIHEQVRSGAITLKDANSLLLKGLQALNATVVM